MVDWDKGYKKGQQSRPVKSLDRTLAYKADLKPTEEGELGPQDHLGTLRSPESTLERIRNQEQDLYQE